MQKGIGVAITLAALCLCMSAMATVQAAADGKQLFQERCGACHPNGGNIINPKKTLHKADRVANKCDTVALLVAKMRHPGPGMTPFDAKSLADSDAKAVAEYILKTF